MVEGRSVKTYWLFGKNFTYQREKAYPKSCQSNVCSFGHIWVTLHYLWTCFFTTAHRWVCRLRIFNSVRLHLMSIFFPMQNNSNFLIDTLNSVFGKNEIQKGASVKKIQTWI